MNRKQRRANVKTGPSAIAERFAAADRMLMAGRPAEAERAYRAILAEDPSHGDSLHRLGVIAHQVGRADLAVEFFNAAIARDGKAASYHAHLGLALAAAGRGDEAIASCRLALALDDRAADTHHNLGALLTARGMLAQAADCFRAAIARDPMLAEAHRNLGDVLMALGRADEAADSFAAASRIVPDQPGLLADLALAELARGNNNGALEAVLTSLSLRETAQNRRAFVQVIKDMRLNAEAGVLKPLLLRAFDWARPDDLARVCADVIRGEADLAHDPLLLTLLCRTPNQDVTLEAQLTAARSRLLARAQAGGAVTEFDCALARQCFLNEYVWAEDEAAQTLRDGLVAVLESGAAADALTIVAVAAFFPLSSLPHAARLLQTAWPPAVEAVLTQQLREPAEEEKLRAQIPALTSISDPVSRAVRAQYEENPYPRWVTLAPAPPQQALTEYLRARFPHAAFSDVAAAPEILVAGCGTGRNAIETARLFAGTRTLAVDLSRASLAHALRKTPAGLAITYAQADILALDMPQRFDLIEATGVLHHLADPFAGWRALLALLKPGGVMHIGLYSATARRDLEAARAGLGEVRDIRKARQMLIAAGDPVTERPDFFTTSTCRDLLFHVQEHVLELPQIAAFLRDEGLALLGFDLDEAVLMTYRRRFPADAAAIDLGNWHAFELDNPATFTGMYQFWMRKT